MTDGDAKTVAEIDATEATPLDVTFTFGGGVVAPEGIRVTLPEGSDSAAARVEILVSTVSAHAGFRSLRADPLAAEGKPQTFEFPATAARWIIVRLAPQPGARKVAAAEVEVIGREGEPKSHYAFAESPAKAFDVLARLEKTTSLKLAVSDDEKAMFAKAKAGRLTPVEFAEAALLASGVVDAGKRKKYLKRLDALEQQARAAVANARTPAAKGEALLKWLHKGPMSKGYVAHQTDLSVIFDTGTFNCVSSAALYNALALRLGLDVRAIEVPDHAFSILYDGTRHMDVETTNAKGFNPARDKAAIAKFEQMTGFRYIPDAHRDQRREVEEAGLAAIIYYNHGVLLSEEKRYHEALVANFRAMSLDPEFGSAVKNALAVLAKWGAELSRDGKFPEALEVVTTGLALAPKDAALVNNQSAVWSQWALSAVDAGKPAEALAILKRAAVAVPSGGFEGMQSLVYIRPADKRMREGRWDDALAAAVPGFEALAGEPRKELEKWLGYFGQEWSAALAKKEGEAKALGALRGLRGALPRKRARDFGGGQPRAPDGVRAGRRGEVRGGARGDPGGQGLDERRGRRPRCVALCLRQLGEALHEGRSVGTGCGRVREGARRGIPRRALLKQNVAYLGQEWTKAAYAKGGTPAAAAVAKALAAKFPGSSRSRSPACREVGRTVHNSIENGKFEAALAAVDQGKELLPGDEAQELYFAAYDGWAKRHMQDGRVGEGGRRLRGGSRAVPRDGKAPGEHRMVCAGVGEGSGRWAGAGQGGGRAASVEAEVPGPAERGAIGEEPPEQHGERSRAGRQTRGGARGAREAEGPRGRGGGRGEARGVRVRPVGEDVHRQEGLGRGDCDLRQGPRAVSEPRIVQAEQGVLHRAKEQVSAGPVRAHRTADPATSLWSNKWTALSRLNDADWDRLKREMRTARSKRLRSICRPRTCF